MTEETDGRRDFFHLEWFPFWEDKNDEDDSDDDIGGDKEDSWCKCFKV